VQTTSSYILHYFTRYFTRDGVEIPSVLPRKSSAFYFGQGAKLAGMKIPDRGPIQPKEMPKAGNQNCGNKPSNQKARSKAYCTRSGSGLRWLEAIDGYRSL